MQSPGFTIRRATVEDLSALKQLWRQAGLSVLEEERHLTEFQVMLSPDGGLIGAAGLHLNGKQGKIHSEAFTKPEHEESFRPHLWERLRSVARNHGLTRLWTLENSPFWHREAGFALAGEDQLKKFPAGFGDRHAPWQTLQIKDESIAAVSLEHEFELFQQAQKESTDQVLRKARQLKVLAYILMIPVLAVVAYVIIGVVQRGPNLLDFFRR